MGLTDDVARHNADLAHHEADRLRHENLHVGPPPKPVRSCRLCREAERLAEVEAMIAAGKLVRG